MGIQLMIFTSSVLRARPLISVSMSFLLRKRPRKPFTGSVWLAQSTHLVESRNSFEPQGHPQGMASLRNRSVWEWKASTLIEIAAAFRASQREACVVASENVFKVQAKVMKSTPDLEAQAESRAGAGVLRNARAKWYHLLAWSRTLLKGESRH